MTLVRWMPRRDLMSMQQDLNRMFNSLFSNEVRDEEAVAWLPRIDVVEDKERYVVKADIPGVRKDEVKITLHENVLTLRGERAEEAKQDGESFHIVERRVGKFSRSLTLPTNVDAGKISAKVVDGVLTVVLPKQEEAKPREISIEMN